MKENIKYFTRDCCDGLLLFTSTPDLRKEYEIGEIASSRFHFVNSVSPVSINKDVELDPDVKKDFENSKIIFEELQEIDLVQANDARLWTTLTHHRFLEYSYSRWNEPGRSWSDRKVQDRFHFLGRGIQARMRNAISRLWWAARVTYDESRDNPYELTEILWETQDLFQGIVERRYGTYPNVVQGFLEHYRDNRQLKEDEIRTLYTGLNSIGGVKILPLLDKEEIKQELIKISDFSAIKYN